MLIIRNNKPDFKTLFKGFLDEYEKAERSRYQSSFWDGYDDYGYGYDGWGDWDDNWGYDERYYPCNVSFQNNRAKRLLEDYQEKFSVGKSNKRGSRGKHKSKCIPLYPNGNNKKRYSDNKNNMFDKRGDDKVIYFYDDIDNPEEATIFYNVFDFDKFLDEEGISVNECEVTNLLTRSVSHCCVNPKERLMGRNTLLTDSSYGNLRWECAESNDELVGVKHNK